MHFPTMKLKHILDNKLLKGLKNKAKIILLFLLIFNNLIQNDISIEIINDCINNNKSKHDIYFTEINFAWTFVITHESEFGPYFSFS